jgi:hypothetical protein
MPQSRRILAIEGTPLNDADFSGTDLARAINLTSEQQRQMKGDVRKEKEPTI